jgi:hypothetical protein
MAAQLVVEALGFYVVLGFFWVLPVLSTARFVLLP